MRQVALGAVVAFSLTALGLWLWTASAPAPPPPAASNPPPGPQLLLHKPVRPVSLLKLDPVNQKIPVVVMPLSPIDAGASGP